MRARSAAPPRDSRGIQSDVCRDPCHERNNLHMVCERVHGRQPELVANGERRRQRRRDLLLGGGPRVRVLHCNRQRSVALRDLSRVELLLSLLCLGPARLLRRRQAELGQRRQVRRRARDPDRLGEHHLLRVLGPRPVSQPLLCDAVAKVCARGARRTLHVPRVREPADASQAPRLRPPDL
eukprot:Amastigsp_a851755_120.p3 type:complete len:181 gc:universal Amastigsp_a851755_120:704-162(-)